MRRTRTSCSVTRASRVLRWCVLARERTTAKASSGEMIATNRHRRHTQPTIPTPLPCPPPLAFSLPAGASPSQSALLLFLSLCLCLPVPLPNKYCTWCCVHGGESPHLGCHRVCLWEGGGPRAGKGGRGGEQCHAFLPSPALWVSIPYMCVPTASITFWDCGHAMCVLPRPCPACMGKQAYFCGV